uniref:Uncharacterized protein n=1 Tax=Oryza nivara TaxID=4536 RepID=A0A0E0H0M8_ORYNI
MTTTTSLGVVPLLGGVVLTLTSPSTKNPLLAMGHWWIPAMSPKLYKPRSELLRCRGATKLGNDDTMQSLYWIIDASWQCTLDTALYLDAISSLSWNISNVPKLQQSLIEQMLSHNNEIPGLISGGFMKA